MIALDILRCLRKDGAHRLLAATPHRPARRARHELTGHRGAPAGRVVGPARGRRGPLLERGARRRAGSVLPGGRPTSPTP
ncbi:hypothetical protein HBB16_16060 [Pseudonocardia sp. MCCB 268]|nr:hypothetical protein [Pseudonocardia cytotoxica]